MTNRDTLLTAGVLLAVFLAGGLVGAAVATTVVSADEAAARAAAGRESAASGQRAADRGDGVHAGEARGEEREGPDGKREGRRRGPAFAVSRLLHEELDLDAGQERRVDAVLERRRERAHEIFDDAKSRLHSQFDSTIDELEEVLTGRQAARFDTLLERLKERRGWGDGETTEPDPDDEPGRGGG